MEKLEFLTPQQEAMIPIVRQEWLDQFYKNKGIINRPLFEKQITWLYKTYLKKDAPSVWYCESPLMCQIVINLLNLNANLRDNLRDNLGDKMTYNPTSYWGNVSDFGWVAFYDYIQRLNYFQYDYIDFDNFKLLLKSGVYDFLAFPSIVFVSSCPFEVHQDENTRLHNVAGPSVRFKDGYEVFSIHGRILPSWIWEKKDTITKHQFITEKNAEIRGAMYAILGEKRIMEMLDCVEIDKQLIEHLNGDIEIIKLYRTKEMIRITENLSNYLSWVKFICPSTGTEYLIACEPNYNNAKEAAASLSIFDKSEYSFNFRT